jgi:hypothetical protein
VSTTSTLPQLRADGVEYMPLVFSCYGRPRPDAVALLRFISQVAARRQGVSDAAALLARVRAAIRRGGARSMEKVQVGDLTLHRVNHEVHCHGKPVILTARQYALLEFLAMRAGETVTRPILLDHVWHLQFDPGSNVVDVYLKARARQHRSNHAPPHAADMYIHI